MPFGMRWHSDRDQCFASLRPRIATPRFFPWDGTLDAQADCVGRQVVLADDGVRCLERVDVELLGRREWLCGSRSVTPCPPYEHGFEWLLVEGVVPVESWSSVVLRPLGPALGDQPATIRVPCSGVPYALGPATYAVTVAPDWTVETPHDLAAERVALAFGGYSSCLELVEKGVPAARRRRQSGGGWVLQSLPRVAVGNQREVGCLRR